MSTYFDTFKLRDFDVVDSGPGVTKQDILNEFRSRLAWMKTQGENFISGGGLNRVTETVLAGDAKFGGSPNSASRALGLRPLEDHPHSAYNMAEMFGAVMVMTAAGYVNSCAIVDVIASMSVDLDDVTSSDVVKLFSDTYPGMKKPAAQYVSDVLRRLKKTGVVHGEPKFTPMLPLNSTDMYHCKLSRSGRDVFLTVSFGAGSLGQVTVKFRAPAGERFDGQTRRPTVQYDRRGRLVFSFAVVHEAPDEAPSEVCLGTDLGQIEPTMSTLLSKDGYSRAFSADRHVLRLSKKIDRLWRHHDELSAKARLCESRGHLRKAAVLSLEAKRVRAKATRMKAERTVRMAARVVSIAASFGAFVAIEDLRWVSAKRLGGKWDHARFASEVESQARRKGVKVKRVNAAGTTTKCSWCDGDLVVSGRMTRCKSCGRKLNRDVGASRSVARRGFYPRAKALRGLVQTSFRPTYTLASGPVTPGGSGTLTDSVLSSFP